MIKNGMRPVHPGEALRLARYFDNSPHFWLNLQTAYDLRLAEIADGKKIDREVSVMHKSA